MRDIPSQILRQIPFTHLWALKTSVGKAVSVLDVGCNTGGLMKRLVVGENWAVTGIDIYEDSVLQARKSGVYKKVIKGEALKTLINLARKKQKFDVIFCSQLIEHLDKKDGLKLLSYMEKIATKKIIVSTPRGHTVQRADYIGDNPYQFHRSGWLEPDFTKLGFKVYGLAFKYVWSYDGPGRSMSRPISLFFAFVSFMMSPVVYFYPPLGAGILAVKVM